MYKRIMPKRFINGVLDLTPEELKQLGIKGIITDLDNTLVEWDRADATPELIEWLKELKDAGIKVLIVSNNNEARVRHFAEPLAIPYIFAARKPLTKSFKLGMHMLDLQAHEILMLGDQMLTDMLGANRLKMHTMLVKPVAQSDGFVTRFNRMIERRVYKSLKKKGIQTWEEQ